ncbi:MAG: LPXTG cell wall anchor domain-containing protein [Coriobacteriia bacterium]|nr:LPXTG cell wall anchor domain-containing protein [Coriobacteriia bacterium]
MRPLNAIVRKARRRGKTLLIVSLTVCLICLCAPAVVGAATGEVVIDVSQTFTNIGSVVEPSDTITYRLSPDTATQPMPFGGDALGYDFTLSGTDTIEIGPINFTKLSIVTYKLFCVPPESPYYLLDQEVYTIEVYVGNSLAYYTVIYNSDGEKVDQIVYDQKYLYDGPLTPVALDPPIKKTLTGDKPTTVGTFVFEMKANDPTHPMPPGSSNGIKTMEIVGEGEKDFGWCTYTDQGVYTYTISEVDTKETGYTYDKTIYTITDTVTALSDGQLVLERAITDNYGRDAETLAFTNSYSASKPPSPWQQIGNLISKLPKTGDLNRPITWVLLGAIGLYIILLIGKRRKREEESLTDST